MDTKVRCLHGKTIAMAVAAVLFVAGCGKLWMSYNSFDQTPGAGWRTLAAEGDYGRAAAMIDSYSSRRRDLSKWQVINLRFHAGQMHASAGDYETAVSRFEAALLENEPAHSHIRWNAYVKANIAFLKGDIEALKTCREEIAARGSRQQLAEVDGLIARFGRPYRETFEASID